MHAEGLRHRHFELISHPRHGNFVSVLDPKQLTYEPIRLF